jgi:hypothetical protein
LQITDTQVYYKGYCQECQRMMTNRWID